MSYLYDPTDLDQIHIILPLYNNYFLLYNKTYGCEQIDLIKYINPSSIYKTTYDYTSPYTKRDDSPDLIDLMHLIGGDKLIYLDTEEVTSLVDFKWYIKRLEVNPDNILRKYCATYI